MQQNKGTSRLWETKKVQEQQWKAEHEIFKEFVATNKYALKGSL